MCCSGISFALLARFPLPGGNYGITFYRLSSVEARRSGRGGPNSWCAGVRSGDVLSEGRDVPVLRWVGTMKPKKGGGDTIVALLR